MSEDEYRSGGLSRLSAMLACVTDRARYEAPSGSDGQIAELMERADVSVTLAMPTPELAADLAEWLAEVQRSYLVACERWAAEGTPFEDYGTWHARAVQELMFGLGYVR